MLLSFVVVGAALYWFHYIQKYGNIDRSGETLSFDYDPHQNISTTYSNPKYGVSLTLPGNWSRIGVASNAFVGLADAPPRTSPRFLVILEPAFTGIPLSVDAEASSLASRYAKLARGTLERIERISINGRNARVLYFSGDAANRTVRMAVFDRGPIAYILIIYGPTDATARWQYLDSILPRINQARLVSGPGFRRARDISCPARMLGMGGHPPRSPVATGSPRAADWLASR